MKGNETVIAALNGLLADEMAAVHQYLAHYAALQNWGFEGLAALVKDRADDERRHADKLAGRILELEGRPELGALGLLAYACDEVPAQIEFDREAEVRAVDGYNGAIVVAVEAGDNATRAMLENILVEETEHLAEIEGWQDRVGMMGLPQFLSTMTEGAD